MEKSTKWIAYMLIPNACMLTHNQSILMLTTTPSERGESSTLNWYENVHKKLKIEGKIDKNDCLYAYPPRLYAHPQPIYPHAHHYAIRKRGELDPQLIWKCPQKIENRGKNRQKWLPICLSPTPVCSPTTNLSSCSPLRHQREGRARPSSDMKMSKKLKIEEKSKKMIAYMLIPHACMLTHNQSILMLPLRHQWEGRARPSTDMKMSTKI